MDLDWCLICEQKTQGTLYCSEECRFKDYLSAYTLSPPTSPTSSGSSTPTDSGSSTSIATNSSFVYPFYRKPSPCFQRPPIIENKNKTMKKSQYALNSDFKNTIEKDSNANLLSRSLDTRHLHI